MRTVDWILSGLRIFSAIPPVPEHPSRILISNGADFGDLVVLLPALKLLREMFPAAEIGFLSSAKTVAVLAGTGLVDRHHLLGTRFLDIVKHKSGLVRVRSLFEFTRACWKVARELRAVGYDVAIDTYLFPFPASPLLYLAGIPVRGGFGSGGFGPLLTHVVHPGAEPLPVSDCPREIISALWPGLVSKAQRLVPCYPGHPTVAVSPFGVGERYWLAHMGAGATYKEWPEENWLTLLVSLSERSIKLLLTGSGRRERERVERLTASIGRAGVRGSVDRPWSEFVAAVAGAEHVICLDSSVAHVAAAFDIPTTALFTGINDLSEWRPARDNCQILMASVGCAPCNRRDCAEMVCIRDISPGDVMRHLPLAPQDP